MQRCQKIPTCRGSRDQVATCVGSKGRVEGRVRVRCAKRQKREWQGSVKSLHRWRDSSKRERGDKSTWVEEVKKGRRDEKKRHTKRPPNAAKTLKIKRSFKPRTSLQRRWVPRFAPGVFQFDRLASVVAPGLGLPAPAPAHGLEQLRRPARAPWPL